MDPMLATWTLLLVLVYICQTSERMGWYSTPSSCKLLTIVSTRDWIRSGLNCCVLVCQTRICITKPKNANPILYPDSKFHGANMGPIWGRQDPVGPHVGSMNLYIWVCIFDGNIATIKLQTRPVEDFTRFHFGLVTPTCVTGRNTSQG